MQARDLAKSNANGVRREIHSTPNRRAAEQVKKWMLDGHSSTDIFEALAAEHPNADPSAAIDNALESFHAVATADLTVLRGWSLEAYRNLYQKMVDMGDYANATRCVKAIYDISRTPRNVPTHESGTTAT